jgi:hypothetical protein
MSRMQAAATGGNHWRRARCLAASVMILAAAACGGGSTQPAQPGAGPVAPPPPAPPPPPVRGSEVIGINVGELWFYSGERDFMNLLKNDEWRSARADGWVSMAPGQVAEDGTVKWVSPGEKAVIMLNQPAQTANPVTIRCTYLGTGTVVPGGGITQIRQLDHAVEFNWQVNGTDRANVWLALESTNTADPVRNMDCREADADKNKLFADEFLASLQPYGVIRFLGWQVPNLTTETNWASRTLPSRFSRGNGASVEHMLALTNQLNADPWFHMPYAADEEYITKFAQYVHDNLRAGRRVYVELGNEVWNGQFRDSNIAAQEGLAAGLSDNPFQAQLRRYAQKSKYVHAIWARVFADRPNQLVRVVSSQHGNPWTAETILEFEDTANHVDALATAPYFFISSTDGNTVDELLLALGANADAQIQRALENKAVAARFGKRHITYEAGQHLIWADVALNASIQRHPRMEEIYTRYLERWRNEVGDLMVLFSATSPISQWGAWGIREYGGQPLSETPKRRAVLAAAARR